MQFFFTLFIFMNKAKTANKSPFTGTERPKEKILSAFNFLKARFNFLKGRLRRLFPSPETGNKSGMNMKSDFGRPPCREMMQTP